MAPPPWGPSIHFLDLYTMPSDLQYTTAPSWASRPRFQVSCHNQQERVFCKNVNFCRKCQASTNHSKATSRSAETPAWMQTPKPARSAPFKPPGQQLALASSHSSLKVSEAVSVYLFKCEWCRKTFFVLFLMWTVTFLILGYSFAYHQQLPLGLCCDT